MEYLPFKWEEISTSVSCKNGSLFKSSKKQKTILNDISGVVATNSLIAILGPSGAGKTSLLTTLGGRARHYQGRIFVNNKIIDSYNLKQLTGYVYQEFIATETLTVKEYLNFMNAFICNFSEKIQPKTVNELAIELNLQHILNSQLRYLSGGEKKRVAIAVQLLRNPPYLFCDEPLSGLDSYSAMNMLKSLSDQVTFGNKLVIITIHQPSSNMFDFFHEIILLSKGSLIFKGTKFDAKRFFDNANLRCPNTYNPLDFYIAQITDRNIESERRITDLKNRYLKENQLERMAFPYAKFEEPKHSNTPNVRKKTGLYTEMKWLIWRISVSSSRNLGYHIGQFALIMSTSFFLAIGYYSMSVETESSVQNYEGLLFLMTTELIFTSIYSVLYTFPEEFAVFSRETNIYSTKAYFISKVITMFPFCFLVCFCFIGMIFLLVNFPNPFITFLQITLVFALGCCTGVTWGLLMSASFSSLAVMQLVLIFLDSAAMMVAGLLSNARSLPIYITWVKYVSPLYYTYESISILHWSEVIHLECTSNATLPCYKDGAEVLEFLGFSTSKVSVLFNLFYLCLLTLAFSFIGYIGLVRKLKRHN